MNRPTDIFLLADWSELIGTLVFLGIMAARFLLSGKEEPAAKPPPRRPAPPEQDAMRAEIDDFLRRSKGLPAQDAETEEAGEEDYEPATQSPERPSWRQREEISLDYDPGEARKADPRQASVAEHVSQHIQHLEESQLAEQASRLGYDLSQTDERLAARLQSKFEHRLGKLDRKSTSEEPAAAEATGPLAPEKIASMLATPEGVQSAVILNEILTRPVNRW